MSLSTLSAIQQLGLLWLIHCTAPQNSAKIHVQEPICNSNGNRVCLNRFYQGWRATAINYSVQGTHVPISNVRKQYGGVLLGGLDEEHFRSLPAEVLRSQYRTASEGAGKRFLLAPGCSAPNDSTDAELLRVPEILGA